MLLTLLLPNLGMGASPVAAGVVVGSADTATVSVPTWSATVSQPTWTATVSVPSWSATVEEG